MKKNLLITAHSYAAESLFAGPTYKKHAAEDTIKFMLSHHGFPAFESGNYNLDTNDIKTYSYGSFPTYVCDYRNILDVNGNKKYDIIFAIDGQPAEKMLNIFGYILQSYSTALSRCTDKEHNKKIAEFTIEQIVGVSKIHLGELVNSYVNIMSDDSSTFIGKVPGITSLGGDIKTYIELNKLNPIRPPIIKALNDMLATQTIKPGCKITVSANGPNDYEEQAVIEVANVRNAKDAAAAFSIYEKWDAENYPLLIIRVEPHIAGGRQRRRLPRTKSHAKSRGVLPRTKRRTKSRRAK